MQEIASEFFSLKFLVLNVGFAILLGVFTNIITDPIRKFLFGRLSNGTKARLIAHMLWATYFFQAFLVLKYGGRKDGLLPISLVVQLTAYCTAIWTGMQAYTTYRVIGFQRLDAAIQSVKVGFGYWCWGWPLPVIAFALVGHGFVSTLQIFAAATIWFAISGFRLFGARFSPENKYID